MCYSPGREAVIDDYGANIVTFGRTNNIRSRCRRDGSHGRVKSPPTSICQTLPAACELGTNCGSDMKIAAPLLAILIMAFTSPAQTISPVSPAAIYTDPPIDLVHPASTLAIEIVSHGSVMNGLVYRPSGRGPFPLAVLMHGLPGNEQNLDLAQALRRSGWAVMTFHYRGCFGSEGLFSIDHVLEDANVAVAHAALPSVARSWNTIRRGSWLSDTVWADWRPRLPPVGSQDG